MTTGELSEGNIQFLSAPPLEVSRDLIQADGAAVPGVFYDAARDVDALPGQDDSTELDNVKSAGSGPMPLDQVGQQIVEYLRDHLPASDSLGPIGAMQNFTAPVQMAAALPSVLPPHLQQVDNAAETLKGMFETAGSASPSVSPRPPQFYFLPDPVKEHVGESVAAPFEVETIRRDFPILHQKVHGKPLVWLDNAATTQKPRAVIDAVSQFYERDNSNIHRAAHALAARATDAYEQARQRVQQFLGAASPDEIVFTRGTTEAINLVAQTYGRANVGHGDEILVTTLEHHANIVPWQMLAKERCAKLVVVPINDEGEVSLEDFEKLIGPRTRLVAIAHVSNVLGTILPVADIIRTAHRNGVPVCVDGAQSVAHAPVNVQQMDADFFVFSGHKIFAPTGIGVLYARKELLDQMPPWQGGGNMIHNVTFEETTYSEPPAKFEAGTGILAGAVGLGAALEYVTRIGRERIEAYERDLTLYGMKMLGCIAGVRLIGTAPNKVGVFSFVMDGIPTEEVGRRLDLEGIAVRSGHHCAQPTLARYGLKTSVRPSIAMYNTAAELEKLAEAVDRIRRSSS